MTWFLNNISTIIICFVLAGTVAAIIAFMVKNKKHGKSSCGCQGCAMRDKCHGRE